MRCPVKAAASIGRQDRLQGRCDNSETGLTVATVVALSIIIWDARCACDQSSHKDHKLGYVDNCWGGGELGQSHQNPSTLAWGTARKRTIAMHAQGGLHDTGTS